MFPLPPTHAMSVPAQEMGSADAVPVRVMLRVYDIEVEDNAQMVVPRVVKVMFPAPFETEAGIVPPARVQRDKGVETVRGELRAVTRLHVAHRVWAVVTVASDAVVGCDVRRPNAAPPPALRDQSIATSN